jgi:hypothetical protein
MISRKTITSSESNIQKGVNPVELLDRLDNLEATLEQMQHDARDIYKKRPVIAKETTSAILDNLAAIEELAVLTKGRKAKTDNKTRGYALKVYEQKQFWAQMQEEAENDKMDPLTPRTTQNILSSFNNYPMREETTVDGDESMNFYNKIGKNVWSVDGKIQITHQDLMSIPISIRGTAKVEHIQNVASILYHEVRTRYIQGFRGRDLNVERKSVLKHCGGYPGLQSVIRNTSLWRSIVSSLKVLGVVKVDKDGDLSLF